MTTRTRAILALLLSVLFFSTSGLLIKLSDWDALPLNGARSLIAAAVMWAYLRQPRFTWSRAQIAGAASYAVMLITFVQATKWTTAANAVFLQFTAPLWVAVLSILLLRERPQRIDWLTMGTVALGMFLFFSDDLTQFGYWGNLLAIFSGVCMALMLISLRMQKAGSPTETILLGNLMAGALGLPFIVLGDQPVNAREIAILVFLGVFQLGLPFILFTMAIKTLSALEAILLQTLEPILNPIWVFLFAGERPSPSAVAGACIVTAAVTIRAIAAGRFKAQDSPVDQPEPATK
jgi:drug/metabolite transporter (DMT)-like permease